MVKTWSDTPGDTIIYGLLWDRGVTSTRFNTTEVYFGHVGHLGNGMTSDINVLQFITFV